MPFDEDGFLGQQIMEISEGIESKHKLLFKVGYELNRYSFKIRNLLSIDSSKGIHVIGASLFSRIHNGSQSIILLSRMGLSTEAKVILRTILEATFVLKAISDNEDELTGFVNTDKKKQERLLKYIFEKDEKNLFEDLRKSLDKQQLKHLRKEIKEERIRDIEVHEWASKAGMDTFYAYAYRTLNAEVHTDIRALEKYLELDGETLTGINALPSDLDITGTLFTTYTTLHITLHCIDKIFKLEQELVLKEFKGNIMTFRE